MEKYLKYIALLSILIAFFGYFATNIWDIDFWWHIASGKYIVQSHSIPDSDPFFLYTSTGARVNTILKSNWLAQVIFFAIFNDFGIEGIIVLKAFILTACLFLVYIRAISLGSHTFYAMAVMFFAGMTALNFTGERPQLFAFLLATLIFMLIEMNHVSGKKGWLYILPFIMILWGNIHGSVVLGSLLLIILMFISVLKWKINKQKLDWTFILILVFSVSSTLIMPGGIDNYLTVFQMQGGELQERTSEYMTPFEVWRYVHNALPYYWVALVLCILAFYQLMRKREISSIVVISILTVMSLSAYRYIPFFLFISGPYIALGISRWMSRLQLPEKTLNIGIIIFSILFIVQGISYGKFFQTGIKPQKFPENAVKFIEQHKIRGKFFNSVDWGGYLIWYLYPDSKIFIDGRLLDFNKLYRYTHILWLTQEGMKFFEDEQFDLVLLPLQGRFSGSPYTLNIYLSNNPQWTILYKDVNCYLYGRRY